MRHGGGGKPLDQINLDVPHVGMMTALLTLILTGSVFLMPFRYPKAFIKVIVFSTIATPAVMVICHGDQPIYVHPFPCIVLIFAGLWISDEMRQVDAQRKAARAAKIQERKIK